MYRNFYGTKSCPYFPHSFEISYGKPADEQELLLAKVGVEQLPESCLPKGMKVEDHRMTVSEFVNAVPLAFQSIFNVAV